MKIGSVVVKMVALAWVVMGLGMQDVAAEGSEESVSRPYRILHIMSYHTPWRWTEGQLEGFQEAFGAPAEYRVFEMDTKRNGSREWAERKGQEARAIIDSWQPDLIYTTDDAAQEYVARHYVNTDMPIVFSGVNKAPSVYGFEGSSNVTGVLEQEHFAESVELLRTLAPGIRKIAVVFDTAPMWGPVQQRMQAAATILPDELEIGPWDTIATFDEFQRTMKRYEDTVDAVALIGIFNFQDSQGRDVPYQEVLRWTAEHSTLPDLGFWVDRVHHGTLAAVTVSEQEQGLAAGRLARAILVDRKSPASLQMHPTAKGLPVISLARARQLNLMPTTGVLLSAKVIKSYEWQTP